MLVVVCSDVSLAIELHADFVCVTVDALGVERLLCCQDALVALCEVCAKFFAEYVVDDCADDRVIAALKFKYCHCVVCLEVVELFDFEVFVDNEDATAFAVDARVCHSCDLARDVFFRQANCTVSIATIDDVADERVSHTDDDVCCFHIALSLLACEVDEIEVVAYSILTVMTCAFRHLIY